MHHSVERLQLRTHERREGRNEMPNLLLKVPSLNETSRTPFAWAKVESLFTPCTMRYHVQVMDRFTRPHTHERRDERIVIESIACTNENLFARWNPTFASKPRSKGSLVVGGGGKGPRNGYGGRGVDPSNDEFFHTWPTWHKTQCVRRTLYNVSTRE